MPGAPVKSSRIPDGYVPVALSPEAKAAPLRLCVIVRKQPDPVAGHFVVLRDALDSHVLLGCLIDAGHQVHQWLELWLQNLEGLASAPAAAREALLNPILDDRFQRHFKAFDSLDSALLIHTGLESQHPAPMFIDTATWEPVAAVDAFSNSPWALCQDDALLTQKNLPTFSHSCHRYLYVPADPKSPFIPVTPAAPTNSNTVTLNEITGPNPSWIPFNPAAGLLMVRLASPIAYEPYVEMLSGGPWAGVLHGRTALHLDNLADDQQDLSSDQASAASSAGGRLFLGTHGKAGRFVESFHLKLRLLADAVAAVRAMTAATTRPLLNLTAASFQIHLDQASLGRGVNSGTGSTGLPFLWTAQATLVDPGDAVALSLEGADAQYYLRAAGAQTTVYTPANTSHAAAGRGAVRIRKVMTDVGGGGAAILEGTFDTQEKIDPTRNDLLWLRLNLASGRADLYGHVEKDSALAAGEWRFRTAKQHFPEPALAALKAAEGLRTTDVPFEIVPLLSTPCDLYALAVLAVRTLLVNPQTTLAVALDEILSLARQIATEHNAQVPLRDRIRAIFDRDKRFVDSLGPHRLWHEELTPAAAFDLVPPELWLDTLAAILRMFPGIGPDSVCRDFGDSRSGGAAAGIHKAFEPTLADLETLLLRSRSLIVIDWRFNREIHAVLRQFATGIQ